MSEKPGGKSGVKQLMTTARQIRFGTEILLAETRDWQLIREYITNRFSKIELNQNQQLKLERIQFIYNSLCSGKYTEQDVIDMLVQLPAYNISLCQAYNDLKAAKELFPQFNNLKRDFELNVEIEIARKARTKCLAVNDHKNAVAYGNLIKDLLKLLPEESEDDGIDFTGHNYEFTYDPSLIGAPDVDIPELLAYINKKRKVDIKTDLFDELIPG
jgi:hypothetical protein